MKKRLFIISGSSGVGKSSIVKGILKKMPKLELSISCTTRVKRAGDDEGKQYYFITKEEFEKKRSQGEFLEWAIVHGDNYYGTLKSEIERIFQKEKTPLLEIDVQGARILMEKLDFAVAIFIKPEVVEDLIERLRRRGGISSEELEKRMKSIYFENSEAEKYDYIVVNRDGLLQETIEEVAAIIQENID